MFQLILLHVFLSFHCVDFITKYFLTIDFSALMFNNKKQDKFCSLNIRKQLSFLILMWRILYLMRLHFSEVTCCHNRRSFAVNPGGQRFLVGSQLNYIFILFVIFYLVTIISTQKIYSLSIHTMWFLLSILCLFCD